MEKWRRWARIEQLPSTVAQEIAASLNTTTDTPLVLGDRPSYLEVLHWQTSLQPFKTLASVGQAMGGVDNFAVMYDSFIDEAYMDVRTNGTAQQLDSSINMP